MEMIVSDSQRDGKSFGNQENYSSDFIMEKFDERYIFGKSNRSFDYNFVHVCSYFVLCVISTTLCSILINSILRICNFNFQFFEKTYERD